MKVQQYLSFEGRTEEALNFYKQALGAEILMLIRFSESPEPPPPEMVPPGNEHKVMHASFKVGETVLMASDGNCTGMASFGGFSSSLNVQTPEEAEKYFAALSEGGQVQMPLTPTFFSPKFGMLVDKFGVSWMVVVDHQPVQ